MGITSAKHTKTGAIAAIIDGVEVTIPADDMGNRHRRAIADWEAQGNTIAPYTVSMSEARTAAKAQVKIYADQVGARFTDRYPASEVASWPAKMAEARAVQGGGTDAPLLTVEAGILGVSLTDLAATVVAKGTLFEQASAMIAAVRQKTEAAIDAAQSDAEVDAVLAAAKAEAEAKYAELVPPAS